MIQNITSLIIAEEKGCSLSADEIEGVASALRSSSVEFEILLVENGGSLPDLTERERMMGASGVPNLHALRLAKQVDPFAAAMVGIERSIGATLYVAIGSSGINRIVKDVFPVQSENVDLSFFSDNARSHRGHPVAIILNRPLAQFLIGSTEAQYSLRYPQTLQAAGFRISPSPHGPAVRFLGEYLRRLRMMFPLGCGLACVSLLTEIASNSLLRLCISAFSLPLLLSLSKVRRSVARSFIDVAASTSRAPVIIYEASSAWLESPNELNVDDVSVPSVQKPSFAEERNPH